MYRIVSSHISIVIFIVNRLRHHLAERPICHRHAQWYLWFIVS